MKKITVILIRKVFPRADDKTIVFLWAAACVVVGVLWGPLSEIWDALTIYSADPIDFRHILRDHGPQMMTSLLAFWSTAKAAKLVPDFLEDVPLLTEEVTKMTTKVEDNKQQ